MPQSTPAPAPVAEKALEGCLLPFPASEKVFIEGRLPGVRVPLRRISLQNTRDFNDRLVPNEPVVVYDTSGPYTDPDARIPASGNAVSASQRGPRTVRSVPSRLRLIPSACARPQAE